MAIFSIAHLSDTERMFFVSLFLNQVIPAWTQGIPLIKKGGKIKLLVPSALGYGSAGSGKVPGNTVIIFDVELVNFQ